MTSDVTDINNKPLTLESMMAAFDARMTKYEEAWDKRNAEWDKDMQELKASQIRTDKQIAETDKIVKANAKQLGGMGNSNGDFAQEFFFNALFYRKTLFGQEFDQVKTEKRKIKKTGVEVQYDIMLLNGKSACIVEVKYKADTDDVKKIATKMITLFRENFPEHADKTLFLALASMSFDQHVENECKKQGVAMIKQVGDTIEVYDEYLKRF